MYKTTFVLLICQVETIGDAYMVVSGAPDLEENHADKICLMALDMVVVIGDLKDPSTGNSLRIRVGRYYELLYPSTFNINFYYNHHQNSYFPY